MFNRFRFDVLAVGFLCVVAWVAGCDSANNPVSVNDAVNDYGMLDAAAIELHTLSGDYVWLNPYKVEYEGRFFDAENDLTTFSYRVSSTGNGPVMSHFIVELPECAPELASYLPTRQARIGIEPITGIYGIKWHNQVRKDESELYSITFPGDVPQGTIQVSMQGEPREGLPYKAGLLPGPCKDTDGFAVAGAVFDDADTDGVIDAVELGIPDVTVSLENESGEVASTQTDEDGLYRFEGLPAGTYTVRVPATTPGDDFNEELAGYFEHTGADPGDASLEVTVGPDSESNHFGFAPVAQSVIDHIASGDLVTTGKQVKYWKDQLEAAIKGEEGEIDAATLEGYLDLIETIHLEDPYQFGDGNRLKAALDILKHKPDEPDWIELREELLATELNEAHGLGVAGGLQSALIAWGEALVAANAPLEEMSAGKSAFTSLSEAASVFNALNGGGSKTNE